MNFSRSLVFTLLAASAVIAPLSAAFAGFELIAPTPQPRVETPVVPPQDFRPAPMPVAPAPDVEMMSLSDMTTPAAPSRSYASQAQEGVNVPRNVVTSSSGSVELFIDPYPMQAQQQVYGDSSAQTSGMERAMLKESGHLQGVASSGNRISMVPANGSVQSISRYDGSVVGEGLQPAPARISGWSSPSQGITPMMGGEVQPLPSPYEQARPAPLPSYPEPIASETLPPVAAVQTDYPVPAPLVPRAPDAKQVSYQDVPQASQGGFTEAVGFGRDLPLALALSQVVPAEYTFSFASDVNAGETVSWQGGKPWNEALDDMLAPSGMRAAISGNQVVIQNAS